MDGYEYEVQVVENGSIFLPARMRRTMGLTPGVMMGLEVEGDHLLLRPLGRKCALCGKIGRGMASMNGRSICNPCLALAAGLTDPPHGGEE